MSEEYSIGFQEGYQSGWNSALEAAPPQRQPLTDDEIVNLRNEHRHWYAFARAIEAVHGIGNKT